MKSTVTNSQQQSAKQNERNQRYTESAMFKAFLPIFYSMKLFGFYLDTFAFKRSKATMSFGQLYSLTVIFAVCAAVLSNLYPLKNTTCVNPNLFSNFVSVSFYIRCSTNAFY